MGQPYPVTLILCMLIKQTFDCALPKDHEAAVAWNGQLMVKITVNFFTDIEWIK